MNQDDLRSQLSSLLREAWHVGYKRGVQDGQEEVHRMHRNHDEARSMAEALANSRSADVLLAHSERAS